MTAGAGLARADAVALPFAARSVHLGICSPPYFGLRSYQDGGVHYGGQIGSEAGPVDFLRALWAVGDEMWRVLADDGSWWINLGDKYAQRPGQYGMGGEGGGTNLAHQKRQREARRRPPTVIPSDVRSKGLMGLPWRFAMGLICPELYRAHLEPSACWHDDGPGPCRTCPPRSFPQWIGRAEVIWSKPNGLPESVTDRPCRSHEQWFMVTKSPKYFAAVDEVRERQALTGGTDTLPYRRSDDGRGHRHLPNDKSQYNPLGKLPGSVRSVPSEPLRVPDHLGVDHFAAFPSEWPRWIIAGWSPSGICTACGQGRRPVAVRASAERHNNGRHGPTGLTPDNKHGKGASTLDVVPDYRITGYACACPDPSAPTRPAVVLDPFAGTGTVPMMARVMGRFGVGVDLSRDYLRLARWRVFESGHGEKALAKAGKRPKRPPKRRVAPAGQLPGFEARTLFELVST